MKFPEAEARTAVAALDRADWGAGADPPPLG